MFSRRSVAMSVSSGALALGILFATTLPAAAADQVTGSIGCSTWVRTVSNSTGPITASTTHAITPGGQKFWASPGYKNYLWTNSTGGSWRISVSGTLTGHSVTCSGII